MLILAVLSYTGYRFYLAAHALNGSGLGDIFQLTQNQDDQPGTLAYKIHHGERVNVLLMGYGGAAHDGSYLADSLMVISVQGTDRVALTSIPRDTYVKVAAFANGGSYDGKINASYAIPLAKGAFGKLKPEYSEDFNGAGKLASQVVGDYLGQKVDYWVGVDFTAFKKTVDAVGGVDIDNPYLLDDDEYPTEDYGYQHIHFDPGPLHLNGDQALVYARERHADSDFGRSKRQQLLAAAIKDRALSVGAVPKLYDLLSALQDNVHTNLSLNDLKVFGGVAEKINSSDTHRVSIDNTNWQYDTLDPYAGYILLARDRTMNSLHHYIDNELPDPAVLAEKANVQFASTPGQASEGQDLGAVMGVLFKMINFQTMPPQSGSTAPAVTEIHDYSGGKAAKTAQWMAAYFKGTVVTDD
ncbi:MAG: polyisoprenyl-teichoic acid--peptidoglycan teichoic acid transferase, partial [Chloroflexota bacterium]|nr:polyisoprenyl-teichoic acid--peptidoglycan teichoic acid transferase [Chloroflexota bacterium]